MESARIRVLVTAFGAVPGSNAHSGALLGMAAAIRGEIDLVTLKIPNLPHQSRVGDARMFRVRALGDRISRRESFARAVRRQLDAEDYDVVHVRGPTEGAVVAEVHRERGFRLIYEVATFPDEIEGPEAESRWHDAHVRCLEEADLVLVGAEAAARALSEQGFGGKVAVVHPGVDIDAYDWWPSARTESTRLLYLGSFAPDREIPTLLGGIRAASRRIPVRALVAGEPDPVRRERVQRLVGAFGLEGIVRVRGEPRAVGIPALIAASDVAIVTASAVPRFRDYGDLPEPLLEYLACHRPVVAAGVPAVAEVARDERESLLYVPGDEGSLADAVVALAADAEAADELARAGYARARTRFSGAARRRRIAEVYEMLLPGSQSYDSWAEAFDQDGSGMLPMPEGQGETTSEREETNPGEIEETITRVDTSPRIRLDTEKPRRLPALPEPEALLLDAATDPTMDANESGEHDTSTSRRPDDAAERPSDPRERGPDTSPRIDPDGG